MLRLSYPSKKEILLWLGIYSLVLLWSGIGPKDRFTWFLEVSPALIGLIILMLTFRGFPLSRLTYWLILIHCIILMVGGHYTYAEVPLFDWIRDAMGGQRNNYDKLGHLAQGLIPAVIARELLLRLEVIRGNAWLGFFVVCFVLAFSAFYEMVEWWVAVASGDEAVAFLGTQGYVWDTQSDMFLALIGGILAVTFIAPWQDRQLAKGGFLRASVNNH
jgi:putative membrane protein